MAKKGSIKKETGIEDIEEVVNGSLNEVKVSIDLAKPGADKSVEVTVSEAKGSGASEEVAKESSSEDEDEGTDVAPAKSEPEDETEEENSLDSVPEEVTPLTVYLTFDKDKDNVALEVTETFQMDLRKVCNEQGARFTEFNIEGDLTPENLRLLLKALK